MEQERGEAYGGQRSNIGYKLKDLAQAEVNNTEGEGRTGVPKVIQVYSRIHLNPDCFTVKLKMAKYA